MHLSLFMSSSRPLGKRRLAAPSTAVSAFVLFALAMIIIVIPKMTDAQKGSFPFPSANKGVLPTYISRIIPGAAFEGSLFHYYPEDIAIPAGTTIAWFNDDPGQLVQ